MARYSELVSEALEKLGKKEALSKSMAVPAARELCDEMLGIDLQLIARNARHIKEMAYNSNMIETESDAIMEKSHEIARLAKILKGDLAELCELLGNAHE